MTGARIGTWDTPSLLLSSAALWGKKHKDKGHPGEPEVAYGSGLLTLQMVKKHKRENFFNLKSGHIPQAQALLALLSLSGFCPPTPLRESHPGGGVREKNHDQDRTKFWALVSSVCQEQQMN